jgi:hypothetical protein
VECGVKRIWAHFFAPVIFAQRNHKGKKTGLSASIFLSAAGGQKGFPLQSLARPRAVVRKNSQTAGG